jgi:hypothetical protein
MAVQSNIFIWISVLDVKEQIRSVIPQVRMQNVIT